MILPSAEVIDGVPQASVAVAAPGAGTPVGLQPRLDPGGQKVNTGGVLSSTNTSIKQVVFVRPAVPITVSL